MQMDRVQPEIPLDLLIFHTPHTPTGLIIQEELIVEWIFLLNNTVKTLTAYIDHIGSIIQLGRKRIRQIQGYDPQVIVLPLNKYTN